MIEKNTSRYVCICVCMCVCVQFDYFNWKHSRISLLTWETVFSVRYTFLSESPCSFLTWSSRGRGWLEWDMITCVGVKCERGVWQPRLSPAGAPGTLRRGAGPVEFSAARQGGGDTVRHPADRGPGSRVPPAGLAGLPAEAVGDPNTVQ